MKLGEIIANFRAEKDLSLGEFAKLTNLSKTYIAMLEKGINPSTEKEIVPSIQTLQTCASVMGITLDELVNKLDDDQKINFNDNITKQDTKDALSTIYKLVIHENEKAKDDYKDIIKKWDSKKSFNEKFFIALMALLSGGMALSAALANKSDSAQNVNLPEQIANKIKPILEFLNKNYETQKENLSDDDKFDIELLQNSLKITLQIAEKLSRQNKIKS